MEKKEMYKVCGGSFAFDMVIYQTWEEAMDAIQACLKDVEVGDEITISFQPIMMTQDVFDELPRATDEM